MVRELLMLATDYNVKRHETSNWYLSEKLDGVRAFWDGGITTGKPMRDIPWANHNRKNTVIAQSTGLWSRYGNVICAPEWFVRDLPLGRLLDGELWLANKSLEETRSIVSRHSPDHRWRSITYNVFDSPSVVEFCKQGRINNPNFQKMIEEIDMLEYFNRDESNLVCDNFLQTIPLLESIVAAMDCNHLRMVKQQRGLDPHVELDRIVNEGGEGVVLRHPYSFWTPHRTNHMLRIKPKQDDEALVVGYKAGLGKHIGRLGSLIVTWKGKTFDLSGFTDAERYVKDARLFYDHAGDSVPKKKVGSVFEVGSRVTFSYNGLTNGGIPREVRYMRQRPTGE